MKKMKIFEPALCCPTGICGVGVDPELLRISTVLDTLKKHGIVVERYNLNSAPAEFIKDKKVNDYINEKGVDGLPVILVDNEIVITGRYPKNEEFTKLLGLSDEILGKKSNPADAAKKKSGGCSCKGGCC
jgi:hypothetical protein